MTKINKQSPVAQNARKDQYTPSHKSMSFDIEGHSRACDSLIMRKEHVLIGISPFNSRFSTFYVSQLLSWAHAYFSEVDILLPDEKYTTLLLTASGIPQTKAERKVRKELNRHRKRIEQNLEALGESADLTRIIDFSDYQSNPIYKNLMWSAIESYKSNKIFRMACNEMSLQAIRGRLAATVNTHNALRVSEAQINIAVPYIFAEIPFYVDTPRILGKQSSILAYHRPWPIGDAIFSEITPLRINPQQGHGIIRTNHHHTEKTI